MKDKDKGKVKSVLFVCTGNSCRSQMAEGYLRKVLREKGKQSVSVASAGLSAYDGDRPASGSIEVMKRHGVDIKKHKTKPVTEAMIEEADIILAMTLSHQAELHRRFPNSLNKVYLLREFEEKYNPKDPDVFDPIGLPLHAYENCFDMMKKPIEKVADII